MLLTHQSSRGVKAPATMAHTSNPVRAANPKYAEKDLKITGNCERIMSLPYTTSTTALIDRCKQCNQQLIEIDNRGEQHGCLTCNLWTRADSKH